MSILATRYGIANPWLDLRGEPLALERPSDVAPSPVEEPAWDVNAIDHIHEIFRPQRISRGFKLDERAFMEAIEPLPSFLSDAEEAA